MKNEIDILIKDWLDPKFKQKIEKLSLRIDFVNEIETLKIKSKILIDEHSKYRNLMVKNASKCYKNGAMNEECLKINHVADFSRKATEILLDRTLCENTINLAKKFKLYPSEEWSNIIISLIFFSTGTSFLNATMYNDPFLLHKTKNCVVSKRKNDLTNEEELFIKIYPDTSLDDIKESWKVIMIHQVLLRKQFNSKRFYPFKNLETAKKIKELDTKKMSDWERQEEVYGRSDGPNWGKEEVKKKARVRQIRHRSK